MKIKEIFRYSKKNNPDLKEIDDYSNYLFYTKSPNNTTKVLLEKGINPIGEVTHKGAKRIPAIVTRSSAHKIGSKDTPWKDIYNVEKGYIRYFGDNKDSTDPVKKAGNKILLSQFKIHNSPDSSEREKACPIIFFNSKVVDGKAKGYVEFNGFGVITKAERVVQHDRQKDTEFVNYRFDFAVLEMKWENNSFDWQWINDRRDKNLSLNDTLERAPRSWRRWIKKGNQSLDSLRRNVYKLDITKPDEQRPKEGSKEDKTLKEIYKFYNNKNKRFEYLASFITMHIMKKSVYNYKKGWVTKGSSDFGIDFVGRMDIGAEFGSAKIVVLGQAKCEKPNTLTNAMHIARLVAKLKRGWLGVYVTTSSFSENVQQEILEDKYPLLLINGKKLAEEINEIVHDDGYKSLNEFLVKIDSEYKGSIQYRDPEEILSE